MLTALIFIAVIGVLVVVHEFGHFIVAKRAGMRVDEFGFGFPPRLLAWRLRPGAGIEFAFGARSRWDKGDKVPSAQREDNIGTGTTYSINWIPFGGFVKIYGEDGEHRDAPRSFAAKPIGTRLKVIVAGVVMNFLLAVFLLMLGNYVGIRVGIGDEMDEVSAAAKNKMIQVVSVVQDSPADQAGLKMFDEIVGFSTAQEVRDYISANAGKKIELIIRSDSRVEVKEISLPAKDEGDGLLGIVPIRTGLLSYPWYESVWRGLQDAVFLTGQAAVGYYQLFKTLLLKGELIAGVSGPIGIASITGQAAAVGFRFLLQFVALISVNLAILNIIPFPALDGGRALLLIIEKFKGSPVNQKVEAAINSVGFALLILLMIYATIKDVGRLF